MTTTEAEIWWALLDGHAVENETLARLRDAGCNETLSELARRVDAVWSS